MLPYLTGEAKESPRNFFFYMSDDGDILAIRMKDWKVVLMEQRAKQLACWFEPFVKLRAPKMFNLRRDPFERADEKLEHLLGLVPVARLHRLCDAGAGGGADRRVREVPAASEAGLVQPRRRACGSSRRRTAAPATKEHNSSPRFRGERVGASDGASHL